MEKILVFGAGAYARTILPQLVKNYCVIGFVDNKCADGGGEFEGYPILNIDSLLNTDYDIVIVASTVAMTSIVEQLVHMGIERQKINTDYVIIPVKSRVAFLENLAELFTTQGITGSVAEGGVFQGEFAKEINRVFFNQHLYLFDTFEGFDLRDTNVDKAKGFSDSDAGHLSTTSKELVIKKLPHPDIVTVRKGYFPESAHDIVCESFCFVNLDFDLYMPTYEGLKFFAPRMAPGGVILVHDYFNEIYRGVKEAVHEFLNYQDVRLSLFPVGDGVSVGIQC